MSTTPQLGITLVPEGVLDPGASLNLALEQLDTLASAGVVAVLDMDRTAPPDTPANGQQHIVAATATGAWTGLENRLVRYVSDGAFWQEFTPGTNFRMVLDLSDGTLYRWTGSAYAAITGGGGGGSGGASTVVPLSGTAYDLDDLTPNGWHVFTSTDPVVITILDNDEEPIATGAEFGIEARGAGGVTILVDDVAVVVPPKGGTLELEEGDFAVLKCTAADVYKLVGSTVSDES